MRRVVATLSSWPANVTVINGRVTIGHLAAGESGWSIDIFAIRTDMSNPQDPDVGITWTIEYDDANGDHHVVEDVPQFLPGG